MKKYHLQFWLNWHLKCCKIAQLNRRDRPCLDNPINYSTDMFSKK